jgi:alkanesulfonate monooxygenase SsuD/methylene tetrahydromethanopterin reductase-like flavin-dependent oxidoreductase (luciferase family)
VWVAYGGVEEVTAKIREFADAGAKEVTLRITSWDQRGQLKRLAEEVIPALPAGRGWLNA